MKRGQIALTVAFVSLAGIIVIQSLTHPRRAQDGQAEAGLPPLVFIHGNKGSILSKPNGLRCWITLRQALGLASADLRLPLWWDGEVQRHDELVVEGPIEAVAWRDIYGSFLDWASGSGRAFYPFAYDWRRDNLETVDQFTAFVGAISNRHREAKVQVVAHSMGSLISFVALNRTPNLFHSLLFAGAPFGSSVSFLEDLHAGTATGLNGRILNPRILFTFVSSYYVFPSEPNDSGLVEQNGETIPHNWYSADDWERQQLGIFSTSRSSSVTEEQREHLRRALGRARQFRSLLVARQALHYPPISVLASDSHPTLRTVVKGGPCSIGGWDFKTGHREPGDGRVGFSKAMPPQGVAYSQHKTPQQHGDLLKDTGQIETILVQLLHLSRSGRDSSGEL